MGNGSIDIEEVLEKENKHILKTLEKTLQFEPEYLEIKDSLEKDPKLKIQLLQTIALKYNKINPISSSNLLELSEHNSFSAKHNSGAKRGWSEVKSNPTGSSNYSSSVRNSRYHNGLDEESKREYFHNLKVIKKLQKEKKKREKVMQYYTDKEKYKMHSVGQKMEEEQLQREEEKLQQADEWKQR